ncbi:hypothetical protein E4T42_03677 [Aureobasidium subglaciale]|nr:hypothetical protein E4T38_04790 [Aureobasidium subglaciale]KAI5223064.1 hypothetical protein E4T40_04613 [Aureobasidium subglaciale]KAI5226747.1 hypothetical protein E4T41_04556 [Aureobasidium subglaciale]KAI5252109.1 hypothetical protein E4T42_03677 [Aureobasidium subglaciale]KAI5262383.1 hypothetical protein E4T46_04442 [Aureobasidium subglaciale]
MPNIQRQLQNVDPEKTIFMMTFLSELLETPEPLSEDLLSTYKLLIYTVVTNLALRKSQPPQVRPVWTYNRYTDRTQQIIRKPALDGQLLLKVLSHCRDLVLPECASRLVANVAAQTDSMDPQDFDSTILPSLKGIIIRLHEEKDELDFYYKMLFQTRLSNYVDRFVGSEPAQINWSRNPVRCGCAHCRDLNIFLRSPVDHAYRVRASKARRHHLHSQLDAYTDCTHITDRGYAEIMVVTKQGSDFAEKLAAWNKKARSATAALRSLEDWEDTTSSSSQLRELLGVRYTELMTLSTYD